MNQLNNILRPTLRDIQPYNAGLNLDEVKSKYNVTEIAKLASNENPAGPAPEVLESLNLQSSDFFLYPDGSTQSLRQTLASYLDVDGDHLIFGNGSEELISIICRSVIQTGDRVVTLYPSFPLHEDYACLMGADIERIGVTDSLKIDLDALIRAVSKPAKMIIFANPMNPVGCWLNEAELKAVIDAKHPATLLVLDEAYYEYAAAGDYVTGRKILDRTNSNWIILRTFSKAWGLAGLRVGFGICNSGGLRQALDLSRTPFNVNSIAQHAANTALKNDGHMRKCIEDTIEQRELVVHELSSRGYRIAPTLGNFVFFETKYPSIELAERLMERGTIVKPWKQESFKSFLRVSIGTPQENAKFLEDLSSL